MPRAKLPALGEWDGLIHGDLGVLETDGEHVRCHACAGWFKALAHHARQTHRLTPDEYRAIFGLMRAPHWTRPRYLLSSGVTARPSWRGIGR